MKAFKRTKTEAGESTRPESELPLDTWRPLHGTPSKEESS